MSGLTTTEERLVSLPRLAKPLMTAVAATAVLTTAACGGDSTDAAGTDSAETTDGGSDAAPAPGGDYADGTYEANGTYSNPGGTSEVSVELTLEDNTVADVTVTPMASGTSRQFQDQFAGGIADEVVGVAIDDLDVGRVAGSSLTADGFNEAVEQIKADAAA